MRNGGKSPKTPPGRIKPGVGGHHMSSWSRTCDFTGSDVRDRVKSGVPLCKSLQGVQARVAFRLDNKCDVLITWEPNEEPGLDGYQIYATRRVTGNLIVGDDLVSRKIVPPETTRLIIRGEDPLLFKQLLVVRRYFITAFDDTRAPGRS